MCIRVPSWLSSIRLERSRNLVKISLYCLWYKEVFNPLTQLSLMVCFRSESDAAPAVSYNLHVYNTAVTSAHDFTYDYDNVTHMRIFISFWAIHVCTLLLLLVLLLLLILLVLTARITFHRLSTCMLDAELTMKQHVNNVARSCFFHLRRIRRPRRCVGHNTAMQLVCSLVLSRLDYCNIVLSGLPNSTISILQHVQNSAARLVVGLRTQDNTTQELKRLHSALYSCPSSYASSIQGVPFDAHSQGLKWGGMGRYGIPPSQILSNSLKLRPRYGDFSIFSKMAAFAILDLWYVCWDHPRRAFGGLYHCQNLVGIDAVVLIIMHVFSISRVWLENAHSGLIIFFGWGFTPK